MRAVALPRVAMAVAWAAVSVMVARASEATPIDQLAAGAGLEGTAE